jgi:hypothetical protein
MELEIKHVVPYLPYGLEVLVENYNGLKWKQKVTIENYVNYFDKKYINQNIKILNPILRPLSDFQEEQIEEIKAFLNQNWCEVYDEFFDELFEHDWRMHIIILMCPYEILQWFFKNHYDVFGLIEDDLAININTL